LILIVFPGHALTLRHGGDCPPESPHGTEL
jgi:hypothetical protein